MTIMTIMASRTIGSSQARRTFRATFTIASTFAIASTCALALLATPAAAQRGVADDTAALRRAVRGWRVANEPAILREFADLLAIPNVASDSANIRRNAAAIVAAFGRRGVAMRLLESPTGGPPAVYGELRAPGTTAATRTVVLYAHYDGQPVDASAWRGDPWRPVLRDAPLDRGGREVPFPVRSGETGPDWRLHARSASDDKAPVIAMLAALDALRAARVAPGVHLKFYFDGEEEAGDAHAAALLGAHRALLRADAWIFADGPVHASRRPQVVYGVRGVMGLELTVYGPARALHSGHYGNWAPNPIAELVGLLATMRDADGRILVDGWSDSVRALGAAERRVLATVPNEDAALRAALQLARTEAGGAALAERIMLPAMNLRAIRGGLTPSGAAANAIPTEAMASIDFRLVPDQQPAVLRGLLEAHLRRAGWHVTSAVPDAATRAAHGRIARVTWDSGYAALRTSPDLPVSRALVRVASEAAGMPVIEVPMLGGSLPLAIFQDVVDAPLLVLPIANHDNDQHAANENLRLQNLWDGIELYAFVMVRLGKAWR